MSFAYLPWYTGDYLRDTRALSMAGHGCYLLLIAFCWDSRGPLPLDQEEIAAICGARSQEERATMDRVLAKFFVKMTDGWYNSRLDKEIAKANAISGARSEAGRKGYQAKARQVLSKSQASATTPTTNTIPALSDSKTLSGSQANADAKLLLQFLNDKTERDFRPTAKTLEPIVGRLKEGYTVGECKAVIVRKWRDWHKDDKMREYLRPKTLFGATNFAQYIGEVPRETADVE